MTRGLSLLFSGSLLKKAQAFSKHKVGALAARQWAKRFNMRSASLVLGLLAVLLSSQRSAWASKCDVDGDGYDGPQCPGPGAVDCNDNNNRVYPGNAEVCDAFDVDEDCNPFTFGNVDRDFDGQFDNACCNIDELGRRRCGLDCDDNNVAIGPGSQTCGTGGFVFICSIVQGVYTPPWGGHSETQAMRAVWTKATCGSNMTCAAQPNGTAVCR